MNMLNIFVYFAGVLQKVWWKQGRQKKKKKSYRLFTIPPSEIKIQHTYPYLL